jgi:DNA polymerase-3 subunit beta
MTSKQLQEEDERRHSGDALDIGFNITYLLDVLNHIEVDSVEISCDANSAPSRHSGDDFKYVVMPMRI